MKWESYQTLQSNLIYIFVGKFTYEPIFESKRSKFANISLAKASTNRVHSLYSLSQVCFTFCMGIIIQIWPKFASFNQIL